MPKILIMAGGTGGHVFPGLAVAQEMSAMGWQVEWLGTADKMEAQLVPQYGYPLHFTKVQGVRGKGLLRKISTPWMLLKAVMQARKLLKTLQPNVVLGMGGFASGPGGLAARLCGIPLVIHEQNAVFGLTNRYLAKFATRVLCGFDVQAHLSLSKAPANVEFVGNPVRSEFSQLTPASADKEAELNILVVGGSLGALALNQIVPDVIATLRKAHKINVLHQTGKGKLSAVREQYAAQNQPSATQVVEFIDDMALAYQQADVVICRSGALTVAEVSAAAKAAIFVPLPIAVDDHQTYNARSLSDSGAAICIPQSQLNNDLMAQLNAFIEHPDVWQEMAAKAHAYYQSDATKKVSTACIQAAMVSQ